MPELVSVIAALREHCPWMAQLTHASLVEYLVEEAYELAETIETGDAGADPTAADDAELKGELGDVLLQVVLHARLAQERGKFTFDDVTRGLSAKMIRRNPHVFRPDGTLHTEFPASIDEIVQTWDAVKRAEQPARTDPFLGIPKALPALAQAQKSLDRAVRAGHDPQPAAPAPETEAELGEALFAVVRSAAAAGFDAERALRDAVRRYQQQTAGRELPGPGPAT
ncbi:Nucleoside triphosphate pyrophosphohydrolase/pyrophosphatase MazG [Arthrobacter ulcerisalmonis]|uniref:Nucleoside triphosphate pyrophosphohydrolase/pyrophosphatase MazG n=2 Tax=Arthrobacter ulcerisalmonis TaxID=2483813 RepID=A0A3P5X9W8_9MICC|nr:Nucleoside triphosphate pyrophosphohydrolase/pyrophosphatase MazG [Arthrobacter ulcerisalmonis]